MKTPSNIAEGSSTRVAPVSKTPTPESANPGETAKAAEISRGEGDGRLAGSGKEDGNLPEHERRKRIAEAAYYKSERRGFAAGGEEKDWLEAEHEIGDGKDPGKLRPEDNTFPSPK